MRRRLDLAMALVHEPAVLFLDEPTTGLDPNSRVRLWDEVRKLNGSGTTVFLTTQYMEEADRLAGRIAIIDEGRIVADGAPASLKARIGDPTLEVALAAGQDVIAAEAALLPFGETAPARPDHVAVRLQGGAAQVAAVARSLDDAGISVEGLELHNPTLDDVFQAATGRRLEGQSRSSGEIEAVQ
jgi:ABC-2 type transport system ATP-binding protein